jgi:hypothetical protein
MRLQNVQSLKYIAESVFWPIFNVRAGMSKTTVCQYYLVHSVTIQYIGLNTMPLFEYHILTLNPLAYLSYRVNIVSEMPPTVGRAHVN